jgi:GTPase SAR1 family protein
MRTYKVIMLGSSGAGKTVFLASMHKKLSIQGEEGFFIEVQDPVRRQVLESIYAEVATGDKWPMPTDASDQSQSGYEWTFRCCVRIEDRSIHPACQFTYLDYAGGKLTDANVAGEDLVSEAKTADAVLGLLDGRKIYSFMKNNDDEFRNLFLHKDIPSIARIMQYCEAPVHFVISKWDLLEGKYTLGQICDRLLEILEFKNLISQLTGNTVRLIPVSSVGANFATLLPNGKMQKHSGAIPRPFYVEVPLACVLPDALLKRVADLKQQEKEIADKVVTVKPRFGGFLTVIDEFLTNTVVRFLKDNLPDNYQFSPDVLNWAEQKIQKAQDQINQRELEAAQITQERIMQRDKLLKEVKNEETALNYLMNQFLTITSSLDTDFPASKLSNP